MSTRNGISIPHLPLLLLLATRVLSSSAPASTSTVASALPPLSRISRPMPRLGVSFSPAGLLTPFHIGAAEQLKEYKLLSNCTALAGSSGGALAAATSGLGISAEDAIYCSLYVAQRCRDEGPRLTLRTALDKVLEDVLPPDAHEILNNRASNCYIAYTEITPSLQPQFVYRFKDKADLISVLRASCNIPFYFNGNSLAVGVRGTKGVDGFFTMSPNRFGCPDTGATEREILVTPFSASLIGLSPELTRPRGSTLQYDVISPDLLTSSPEILTKKCWPFNFLEVVRMSVGAPASKLTPGQPISDSELEATYNTLFLAGREAVRQW
eukprot:CAMPEP_0173189718 /NCGR_PEP_ID=MMETSP1141-20130122/11953_1 /TAXON_ID=483371 /ORGANISM="non described non described, Strain CCMP2298" /LENGTH=324 /DNA_ID=CAMNT_0014113763 /DNA_START=126 /DNA_END=1097 /DNA_ORIENTATION=+